MEILIGLIAGVVITLLILWIRSWYAGYKRRKVLRRHSKTTYDLDIDDLFLTAAERWQEHKRRNRLPHGP